MDLTRGWSLARFAVAILAFQMISCVAAVTLAAQASLASGAQPLGQPLTTILIFGDQYNGGDELYDAKITVLDVVRGDKAWEVIKKASSSNQAPAAGTEYLLARIHFEFSARNRPFHYNYTINADQFTAASSDGEPYAPAALAAQPQPGLTGTIDSGDSAEGWIAFIVPRTNARPLMVFKEDVGSVIHQGSGVWFRLYKDFSRSSQAKAS
jgi:hypothetical protein